MTPRNGALLFYAVIMFLVFLSVLDKIYKAAYVYSRYLKEGSERTVSHDVFVLLSQKMQHIIIAVIA